MNALWWMAQTYITSENRTITFKNPFWAMRKELHLIVSIHKSNIYWKSDEQCLKFIHIKTP